MSGGGSNNNPLTSYVLPGLETVGGAVSEFFFPGNPIGLGLMGSGIGQLAGRAGGGSKGQAIGGLGGGALGGLGGLFGGASGLFGGGASAATDAYPGPTATAVDGGGFTGPAASSSGGGLSSLFGGGGSGGSSGSSIMQLADPIMSKLLGGSGQQPLPPVQPLPKQQLPPYQPVMAGQAVTAPPSFGGAAGGNSQLAAILQKLLGSTQMA